MKKLLRNFTTFDLVMIALVSSCGIATKPFVRALSQVLAGTIVPAGTVGGVIYMLWIVLACAITKKRGTGILVGIVQSVLVIVFDMLGNRGLANLLVYVVPGITLEVGMLFLPNYVSSVASGFVAGMIANVTGDLIVGAIFMRLPLIPLLVSMCIAGVSGGFGGVLAYKLYSIIQMTKKPHRIAR